MRLRGELFLILLLSAALLSSSLPLYGALAGLPEEVFFGEGVYMLSQASTAHPLTEGLVDDLREQPWALAVSPEVYAFVSIDSHPIVVRGAEAEAFLRVEGQEATSDYGEEFLLLGSRLAAQLGVEPGDSLLIPGSFRPVVMEARVDDLLDLRGAPGDEIVMDLVRARVLAGVVAGGYHMVRVLVTDGQLLVDYLASTGEDILVGDGDDNVQVKDGILTDDRIGALVLSNPELAKELGRSYINYFAKYSGNSLRVVILGMEVLTLTLFVAVLASSMARFLVENRRSIGLLIALGGGFAALVSTYGKRILILGLLAGLLGILLGGGIGSLLRASSTFTFFGHVVLFDLDLMTGLRLFSLYMLALLSTVVLSLLFLLAQRPRDLLREVPEPALVETVVVAE